TDQPLCGRRSPYVQLIVPMLPISNIYSGRCRRFASGLVDALVRRQGEELDEGVVVDQIGEQPRGLVVAALAEGGAQQAADLRDLLGDHGRDHFPRYLAAVVQLALRRADP